jgi:hypothetical protein
LTSLESQDWKKTISLSSLLQVHQVSLHRGTFDLNFDDINLHQAPAVKWIARYLKGTADNGLIYHPDPQLGFDVYVDASFVGEWDPTNTE